MKKLILLALLLGLCFTSCTTILLRTSPPPNCYHMKHEGGPEACLLYNNMDCYYEWAYEHGDLQFDENGECPPYSIERGRPYTIECDADSGECFEVYTEERGRCFPI